MKHFQYAPLAGLLFLAGCFPIELDVNERGELLIARQEGFFLFNPHTRQTTALTGPGEGQPVFARFAPGGKEALLVVKELKSGRFRFDVLPLPKGTPRTVFFAHEAGYVLWSPDGSKLGVVRSSELRHRNSAGKLPELTIVSVGDSSDKMAAEGVGPAFRWFADSKRLLLFQMDDIDKENRWSGHIVELDLATGKSKQLASVISRQSISLDLSPDNQRVLFTAYAAGAPNARLEAKPAPGDFSARIKLFELKLDDPGVRAVDNPVAAEFARFSPSGKKFMMYGGTRLAVSDSDGKKPPVVVADDAMEQVGGDLSLPGWVDDETVYYFTQQRVFGESVKNQRLVIVKTDGTSRKQVQPYLDRDAQSLGKDLQSKAPVDDPRAPWNRRNEPPQTFERPDPLPKSPTPAFNEIVGVNNLAFSGDGKKVMAGWSRGTGVWDLESRKFITSIRSGFSVWTPDEKYAVTMNSVDSMMTVRNVRNDAEVGVAELPKWKGGIRWKTFAGASSDSKYVYTVYDETKLIKLDVAAAKLEILPTKVDYHRNGCYVPALGVVALTVGNYKETSLQLIRPGDKEAFKKVPLSMSPGGLAFTPDGKTAAVSLDGEKVWKQYHRVQLWDTATWTLRAEVPKVPTKDFPLFEIVAISPDGKFVAGTNETWNNRNLTELWEVGGGRIWSKNVCAHALAFTPDSKTLLVGQQNKKLRFIDTASGAER